MLKAHLSAVGLCGYVKIADGAVGEAVCLCVRWMSAVKLHAEFLRRPFVAAFLSGAGRKFATTTKPFSTSHRAGAASLSSAGEEVVAAWSSLAVAPTGGQGWRRTLPGILGHRDGACLGSSMHQCFPAQFWPRILTHGPRAQVGRTEGQSCGASLGGRGLSDAEARGSSCGPVLVSVDVVCVVGGGSLVHGMKPNTKSPSGD